MSEKRGEPRSEVHRPIVVIPLTADGIPDVEHSVHGESIDAGRKGMKLEFTPDGWEEQAGATEATGATAGAVATRAARAPGILVGASLADGRMHFAGLTVRHVEREASGATLAGASLGGPADELLSSDRRRPALDPADMTFHEGMPEATAQRLVDAGVFRPVVLDRLEVCPRCDGLPTLRYGCRRCLSGRISSERLVHHFACAFVAPVAAFGSAEAMTCPKCRAHPLVVGADFEWVPGLHRCEECGWSDTERETVLHCLHCGHRFPRAEAREREMRGYHVDRLEPLDLLPPP